MHEFFASLTPWGFFLSGAVSLSSLWGFRGFRIWDLWGLRESFLSSFSFILSVSSIRCLSLM